MKHNTVSFDSISQGNSFLQKFAFFHDYCLKKIKIETGDFIQDGIFNYSPVMLVSFDITFDNILYNSLKYNKIICTFFNVKNIFLNFNTSRTKNISKFFLVEDIDFSINMKMNLHIIWDILINNKWEKKDECILSFNKGEFRLK